MRPIEAVHTLVGGTVLFFLVAPWWLLLAVGLLFPLLAVLAVVVFLMTPALVLVRKMRSH